jgi:hypothetical protein
MYFCEWVGETIAENFEISNLDQILFWISAYRKPPLLRLESTNKTFSFQFSAL